MIGLPKAGSILIGGSLIALSIAAYAQTSTGTTTTSPSTTTSSSSTVSGDQLVTKYSDFAGSDSNAQSLVDGLRSGKSITLSSSGGSTTFTPPTKPMGYGNVNIALALAEASLSQQGITDPTPQQLQAALMGGTVTTSSGTTKLDGILQSRADGKGWGVIANSLGIRLGDVMRSANATTDRGMTQRSDRAASQGASSRPGFAGSMERPQRIERPERPEKFERPERPERPERSMR